MKKCLLCGEEISNRKIICRDCWDKYSELWDELDDDELLDLEEQYEDIIADREITNIADLAETVNKLIKIAVLYYHQEGSYELIARAEIDINQIFNSLIYKNDETEDDEDEEDFEDKSSSCVICGEESNGYWFCPDCFREYKNKRIAVEFNHCTESSLLDASYESEYICDDGHRVKSKTEQAIDNWLYAHKIWHVYEKEYRYGASPDETLHPDFYLPEMKVYIEHWGKTDDYNYCKRMEYSLNIYKDRKETVICTYENRDGKNIHTALEYYLKNYEKGKINFENEKLKIKPF